MCWHKRHRGFDKVIQYTQTHKVLQASAALVLFIVFWYIFWVWAAVILVFRRCNRYFHEPVEMWLSKHLSLVNLYAVSLTCTLQRRKKAAEVQRQMHSVDMQFHISHLLYLLTCNREICVQNTKKQQFHLLNILNDMRKWYMASNEAAWHGSK